MLDRVVDSFVVDTHPVDDGVVLREPEQSRLGIAWLGFRTEGADLDERESEPRQLIVMLTVLVQTGGKAYRRREVYPEEVS